MLWTVRGPRAPSRTPNCALTSLPVGKEWARLFAMNLHGHWNSNFIQSFTYHQRSLFFWFFFFSFENASLAYGVCEAGYGSGQSPIPVLEQPRPWAGMSPVLLLTPSHWLVHYAWQGEILSLLNILIFWVLKWTIIKLFILMTQFWAPP